MISWWKLLIIFYILFIAFFASFAFAKFKNNNNSNDHHYNNNSIHNINEILHVQSNTADIKPVGVATISINAVTANSSPTLEKQDFSKLMRRALSPFHSTPKVPRTIAPPTHVSGKLIPPLHIVNDAPPPSSHSPSPMPRAAPGVMHTSYLHSDPIDESTPPPPPPPASSSLTTTGALNRLASFETKLHSNSKIAALKSKFSKFKNSPEWKTMLDAEKLLHSQSEGFIKEARSIINIIKDTPNQGPTAPAVIKLPSTYTPNAAATTANNNPSAPLPSISAPVNNFSPHIKAPPTATSSSNTPTPSTHSPPPLTTSILHHSEDHNHNESLTIKEVARGVDYDLVPIVQQAYIANPHTFHIDHHVINGATVTVYVSEIYDPINFFHFVAAPKPYRKKKYSAFIEQQAIIQATNSIDSSTAPTPSSFLSVSSSYGPYNELCDGTAKTSVTSKYHDCDIAMNVGFFDMASGRCFGNLVSRGLIRSVAKGVFAGKCNVGITKNHNYIFGYLNSEDIQHSTIDPHHASTTPITGHVEEEDGGLLELSSGNGWLIRSGHTYLHDAIINEALDNNFINIKAPRNAIGITNNGTLLMLQVDGEEDIKQGLDLYEWTDLLLHHYQLYQAVNVDGGGSSTTIYKNKVVNKPTCVDTPLICERAVTTVACVKQF